MGNPVTTGPIPEAEVKELSVYMESLRRDILALESRLVSEIAEREALDARVQVLEEE